MVTKTIYEFKWTKIEKDGKVGVRVEDDYGSVEIVDISDPTKVSSIYGNIDLERLDGVITDSEKLQEIKKELEIEVNFQVEVSKS